MVQTDFYQANTNTPAKKQSAAGWRVGAVLVCLFALGGLFLGMAGTVNALSFLKHPFSDGTSTFDYSLLGSIINDLKMMVDNFKSLSGATAYVTYFFVYWLDFLILGAAIASIILMIVALVKAESAKQCMKSSASIVFSAYGAFFLYVLIAFSNIALSYSMDTTDFALLIPAGVSFITLCVAALVECKERGLLNLLITLASFATIILFFWPGKLTAVFGLSAFEQISTKGNDLFCAIMSVIVVVIFAVNFFCSVTGLFAKKHGADVARFTLQMISVTLLIVAISNANKWSPAVISHAPAISMFVLSFLALLISIAAFAIGKNMRKAVPKAVAPAVLPQPEPTLMPEQSEPEPVPAAEPAPAPVQPEPVPVAPATPVTPVVAAAAPVETKSEFERYMEALARGEAPQEPTTQPEDSYRNYSYAPAAVSRTAQPATVYSSLYTYDPFLNTLTGEEKNEFGDLFISNKYGTHSYLPAYVIGGDNTEFFRKVFIFLGRFRKDSSRDLLDKLYVYVTQLR